MTRWLSTLTSLIIVTTIGAAARADIFTNDNFSGNIGGMYKTVYSGDSSTISGWTVGGNSVNWDKGPSGYFGLPTSYSGNCVNLTGQNGNFICQTVSTVVGQKYTINFDLSCNPGYGYGNTDVLKCTAGNTSQDFDFNCGSNYYNNMDWITESCTFTATSTSTLCKFICDTDSYCGPICCDFSCTTGTSNGGGSQGVPTPEPASLIIWGLLGTGWVGINMLRGRRGMIGGSKKSRPWSPEPREAIRRIVLRGPTVLD